MFGRLGKIKEGNAMKQIKYENGKIEFITTEKFNKLIESGIKFDVISR